MKGALVIAVLAGWPFLFCGVLALAYAIRPRHRVAVFQLGRGNMNEQQEYEAAGLIGPTLNRETLHDFVVAHGFGAPTDEAYKFAERFDKRDDYATLAAEIVARGLTTDAEQ
jgi:hypothetical protein